MSENSKIQHVFHFSLLKPHQGNWTTNTTSIPPTVVDNHPIIQLAGIINQKILPDSTTQVLVQWHRLLVRKLHQKP